jgi:hypothetical protein
MNPQSLITGLITGCALVVFGLVPGLLHRVAEQVIYEVHAVRDMLLFGAPLTKRRPSEHKSVHRPVWLAGAGAFLITITVLGYLSN